MVVLLFLTCHFTAQLAAAPMLGGISRVCVRENGGPVGRREVLASCAAARSAENLPVAFLQKTPERSAQVPPPGFMVGVAVDEGPQRPSSPPLFVDNNNALSLSENRSAQDQVAFVAVCFSFHCAHGNCSAFEPPFLLICLFALVLGCGFCLFFSALISGWGVCVFVLLLVQCCVLRAFRLRCVSACKRVLRRSVRSKVASVFIILLDEFGAIFPGSGLLPTPWMPPCAFFFTGLFLPGSRPWLSLNPGDF